MSWVLVEMVEVDDYGEAGRSTWKQIGDEAFGPFDTKADADAHGIQLNEQRGWYTWRDRRYRCDERDFEARELIAP